MNRLTATTTLILGCSIALAIYLPTIIDILIAWVLFDLLCVGVVIMAAIALWRHLSKG